MAEPTLVQVFGSGATQDASTLTIQKSALATTGLTATSNNTAESLLVAIILKASSYLTATNLDANTDQSLSVEQGYSSIAIRNNSTYRQDSFTVNLQKPDTSGSIDPNLY
ncbi:MAG: hypothetical protein RMX96_34890 [Nostoc sp. ChiSLP02]|nr:hypothetical protein [Nostoc sp. DedSLP05]MDZ8101557.1 hypothetical protein [Nostoc sp. DedSLP01]MDZ8190010.1 hypothetical protein [Nostoc sp. ChiSLP02]